MTLEDDVAVCVGCGLCLPHCPTFRITGEESHSPRGRISLIRASLEGGSDWSGEARKYLDTCIQCRGCETACPSGVEYGHILAAANRRDETFGRNPSWPMRGFLFVLRHPQLLRVLARIGLLINAVPGLGRLAPSRVRLVGRPVRQGPRLGHAHPDPDVWLFTGCVMDTWFRSVHRATAAILTASGAKVSVPLSDGCCGALHTHAGAESAGLDLARRTMSSMPGLAPIVVNSAGCGAMLKDFGELMDTDEAREFSKRVMDVHQWIESHSELLEIGGRRPAVSPWIEDRLLIVQEPCHLRHAQKISIADVLEKFVPVTRLDDDAMCCGAGGAYSLVQAEMSQAIRRRKSDAIERARRGRRAVIVTSNPGCHLHLAADGHEVVSSAEIIATALGLDHSEARHVR